VGGRGAGQPRWRKDQIGEKRKEKTREIPPPCEDPKDGEASGKGALLQQPKGKGSRVVSSSTSSGRGPVRRRRRWSSIRKRNDQELQRNQNACVQLGQGRGRKKEEQGS